MSNPLLRHALVIVSVAAGILGMGVLFDGALAGDVRSICVGLIVLLMGLWWSGHELGRSMMASRARKAQQHAGPRSG